MELDKYQTLWTNDTNSTLNINSCDNEATKSSTETIIKMINQILLIYPWIMILIGTISNILSFLVFTRPKLRKSSTFFYLSCLCIVDLLTLYTFCINFIGLYLFTIDIQLLNPVLCRIYSFLVYFLPQLSGWIVAAVSFDRVISITLSISGNYTTMARRWNTPKIAARVVAIIFSILFLLNMQFFFYPNEYVFPENEVVKDVNIIYCSAENIPRYQNFYEIWVNIDLFVNVLIPFTVMIGSSLIIIISLVKSTKNLTAVRKNSKKEAKTRQEEEQQKQQADSKTGQVNFNIETNAIVNTNQVPLLPKKNQRKRVSSSNISAKAKNVSAMLVTNNLIFITLTLPIVVFLSFTPPISEVCNLQKAQLLLFKVFFIILMNSNCTVNIFIYYFMSSQFKLELKFILSKLFGFKVNKGQANTTQVSTNA